METELYYTEKGEGMPLVLLHGNGEDGTYFENQIEYFSKSYRVIAVDTRGHGKSPRGTAPFTMEQFADDLKSFFSHIGITKAHILGFSDGGNIGLVFAIKYPDNVEKLVLNGANLYSKGIKPSIQIPIILGYRTARLFASKSDKAKHNAEFLGLMVNEPHLTELDLMKISAKTLVVAGTHDMVKKSHTKLIYRSIKNAKIAFVKGDHFIARKNPAEFNRIVGDFLSKKKI